MARIFLLTVSNQHNAYKLILWLMTYKIYRQNKQRKQLILMDSESIFTSSFQPQQHLQPNFVTDEIKNFIAWHKQRKQLILTDSENIFTYSFQPIQHLQPNFNTDGIKNFIA